MLKIWALAACGKGQASFAQDPACLHAGNYLATQHFDNETHQAKLWDCLVFYDKMAFTLPADRFLVEKKLAKKSSAGFHVTLTTDKDARLGGGMCCTEIQKIDARNIDLKSTVLGYYNRLGRGRDPGT